VVRFGGLGATDAQGRELPTWLELIGGKLRIVVDGKEAAFLTATVAFGSNIACTWVLGDGDTGNGAVLTHTYPAVGVYTAVATASNSVSTVTGTTVVTSTEPSLYIYLPWVVREYR
jgi:hypothetical protein